MNQLTTKKFETNYYCLKWHYDQKIISFFSSDSESVFA